MSNTEDVRSIARPSLVRPVSYQNPAEGSKSRLVQPRYSARSSMLVNTNIQANEIDQPRSPTKESQRSLETTKSIADTSADGTMPTRLRPRSMYQAGTATSQRAEQPAKSNLQPMRPPAPVSKVTEPKTSSLGRTQSLRKPSIPPQPTRHAGSTSHSRTQSVNVAGPASHSRTQSVNVAGPASHSRTQSVNATGPTRRDVAKSVVTLERPRSLVGVSNAGVRSNGPPVDNVSAGGNVSSRLAGHGRSASTKTKFGLLPSGADVKSLSRPDEPLLTQSGHRDGIPEGTKKSMRPAFTTLQQHFTPRKAGKAATATFLHPAPVAGPQTLPPEVTNLQAELLQLHLLHQSCAEVCRQWERSAKCKLRSKFEKVASLHQTMLAHERVAQEQKNLQSLLDWSSGKSSTGLVEHIQILSEPLHELPSLVDSGGRFQRCVGEFQHWVSWVQQVRAARQDETEDMAGTRTIEGLGDAWKAEIAALIRKLTSFTRALNSLPDPSPGSSLLCIVDACKSLLGGILEELQIMQTIEAEIITREKLWVEDRLKLIARAIGSYTVDVDADVAAWRS